MILQNMAVERDAASKAKAANSEMGKMLPWNTCQNLKKAKKRWVVVGV